jgi:hypothetical protein
LSKFIDLYKILITYDYFSAANGVINKQGLLKIDDVSKKFLSTEVRLFTYIIKIYFPNSNLHKVLMEIKLLEIDEELMSMSMNDAISKKLINNNWSEEYSPG